MRVAQSPWGAPRPPDVAPVSVALLAVEQLYSRREFGSEVPTLIASTSGARPLAKPIKHQQRQIIINSPYLIPRTYPFQSKSSTPPESDAKTQRPRASSEGQKDSNSSQIKPAHQWRPDALSVAPIFKQTPSSRALALGRKH